MLTASILAKKGDVPVHTVRHYIKLELLKPIIHPQNGYRIYGRRIKSLFRIGLDYLQNLLVNLHLQSKWSEFNILAKLLSCT